MIPTLEWLPTGVNFLDQTKLPLEETYVLATDYKQVAVVIRDMIVRGAPAIGVSAAMGMAIGIDRSTATSIPALTTEVAVIAKTLAETRPTAVNLFWGIDEIRNLYNDLAARNTPISEIKSAVVAKARRMYDEDIAACKQMGAHGAALLPMEGTVLTHCNAGALATCGYGSALGVIRDMIVRGAPAIGVSAAMGMAIGIDRSTATTLPALTAEVAVIAKTLAETRPTAVNLFWGIDEIRNLYNDLAAKSTPIPEIKAAVV